MNNTLNKLYNSKWEKYHIELQNIWKDESLIKKPTNPLLLKIDDEVDFINSDLKVMIFGQETNGWYENSDDINSISNEYSNFYGTGYCYKYGGQFWNGVNRFQTLLQAKFPSKKIRFVWNNIVKTGKSDGRGMPPNYIYEVERNYFSIIKDELKIIKPNIVVFLTGPNYDWVIKDNFGLLNYEPLFPYSERQLSKVSLESVDFCFRTYHPNYLWRNNINSYFDRIIDEILFN